jgi:hypothetical protein
VTRLDVAIAIVGSLIAAGVIAWCTLSDGAQLARSRYGTAAESPGTIRPPSLR